MLTKMVPDSCYIADEDKRWMIHICISIEANATDCCSPGPFWRDLRL